MAIPPSSPTQSGQQQRGRGPQGYRSRSVYYRRLQEKMRKACSGPLILLGNLVPLVGFALFLPTLFFEDEKGSNAIADWAHADSAVDLKDSPIDGPPSSLPPPSKIPWAESLTEVQEQQPEKEDECEPVGGPPVHVTLFMAFVAGGLLDSQTFRKTMPMF